MTASGQIPILLLPGVDGTGELLDELASRLSLHGQGRRCVLQRVAIAATPFGPQSRLGALANAPERCQAYLPLVNAAPFFYVFSHDNAS